MSLELAQPAQDAVRRGVSVIIPCYQQAQYLSQAIESVLAQNFRLLEIIVINDGSPDDTAAVAARFGHRIKYIEQKNQGVSAARNAGLRLARGEFLHFLDADDYVLPGFYDKMVAVLNQRPDAAACYCGYRFVDLAGACLLEREPISESKDWFHLLLEKNNWPCHSLLVRAAVLLTTGGFDANLRSCEDWDLWLRLALSGSRFASVPGFIGVSYRKYPQSLSTNPWMMQETGLSVLRNNVRRHHNCPLCGISLAKGLNNWRDFCFEDKLQPRLESLVDQGRLFGCLRECGRVLRYDPALAWRALQLVRHRKRRLLAGLLRRE